MQNNITGKISHQGHSIDYVHQRGLFKLFKATVGDSGFVLMKQVSKGGGGGDGDGDGDGFTVNVMMWCVMCVMVC